MPVRADIYQVASGVDSVHLSVRALLRNALADTLTLDTSCGIAVVHLEYSDGTRWRPVLRGLAVQYCLAMYSEVRVAPGDSAVFAAEIGGNRAERAFGVRWLAPLPARYRFSTTASRCMRDTRRDCWVTLASAPFELSAAASPEGRP